MGNLTHTVSGDIAHFRTPSRVPLTSLKCHFLPKQDGSGDPSLSNVRPITGWNGLNIRQEGKNLIDLNALTGTDSVWWKGKITTGYANHCVTPKIPVKPGATYCLNRNSGSQSYVCYFDENGDYVSQETWDNYVPSRIIPDDVYFVGITISTLYLNDPKPQFELGSKATEYADYVNPRIIPITFPVSDDNLFSYDEDNFALEDCINSSGTVLRRQVYHTGLSNGVFMLTAQIKEGYTRPSYNLFNVGICENGVNTIINTFIGTTEYIRGNYVNSDQELIIVSTTDSLYTADQTIKRYDIEIKNDAFYGGYVDVALGEIVLTHAKTFVMWGEDGSDLGTVKRRSYTLPFTYKTGQELHDNGQGEYKKMTLCDKAKWKWDYTADIEHYYIHGKNAYIYLDKSTPNDTRIELCAMLAEPFHIAISPQALQAFLDHNNFWSDANDITEVTYAVTESKDILETRKKAATFEAGHHKICEWNQLQMDGNFTDISKWEIGNNYGTMSFSNNIGTWTCTTQPTQFYQTGIRIKNGSNNSNFLHIPWNHKVLVRGYVRCSMSSRIRIYGLIGSYGNTYVYHYNYENANLPANEWVKLFGFISDRPETPPGSADDVVIKRFRATLFGTSGTISTITVGTTLEMKNFMAFDLTQMFGLGNEPSTVEEFERICRINGIDLDTYQPYDEGSNRWLTLP